MGSSLDLRKNNKNGGTDENSPFLPVPDPFQGTTSFRLFGRLPYPGWNAVLIDIFPGYMTVEYLTLEHYHEFKDPVPGEWHDIWGYGRYDSPDKLPPTSFDAVTSSISPEVSFAKLNIRDTLSTIEKNRGNRYKILSDTTLARLHSFTQFLQTHDDDAKTVCHRFIVAPQFNPTVSPGIQAALFKTFLSSCPGLQGFVVWSGSTVVCQKSTKADIFASTPVGPLVDKVQNLNLEE